jgi:hypothetical protein
MNFNVPQYIEVEDKIAFQLTLKQLAWLSLGAMGLFFLWQMDSMVAFIMLGAPVALLALAFAFYKPAGMTFLQFILNGILYLFKPKVFAWHRNAKNTKQRLIKTEKSENKQVLINRYNKENKLKSSKNLADLLDTNSKI